MPFPSDCQMAPFQDFNLIIACSEPPTNLMGWTPPDGLYGKVEVLKHH
jgi:hypothetical protein